MERVTEDGKKGTDGAAGPLSSSASLARPSGTATYSEWFRVSGDAELGKVEF